MSGEAVRRGEGVRRSVRVGDLADLNTPKFTSIIVLALSGAQRWARSPGHAFARTPTSLHVREACRAPQNQPANLLHVLVLPALSTGAAPVERAKPSTKGLSFAAADALRWC